MAVWASRACSAASCLQRTTPFGFALSGTRMLGSIVGVTATMHPHTWWLGSHCVDGFPPQDGTYVRRDAHELLVRECRVPARWRVGRDPPHEARPSRGGRPVTPEALLQTLAPERAAELGRVRRVITRHLPRGYEEVVQGRMIVYQVPLAQYPDTYNGQPLWLAALAAPKSYLTLHLMPAYGDAALLKRLTDAFHTKGKKLDIGKACIRFKKADDLELDAIGTAVAGMPMHRWIAIARGARRR
jgi:hypothetical protein